MELIKSIYKSTLGRIEGLVHGFGTPSSDCVVLCLHSTPEAYMPQFKRIIQRLQQSYTIIGPQQFEKHLRTNPSDGPFLLITFDDGIKNNFYAAEWLNSIGLSAYFFVVPDFILSQEPKEYYLQHIRPIVDPSFENATDDFNSLSISELKMLGQMGHAIGSHTMSHDLHGEMTKVQIEHEIIGSKEWLENTIGVAITSFCSPNNTIWSVNSTAKALINSHYQMHFTTFPGNQISPPYPHLIMRRNIEINWSWSRIQFALGQWDLSRWHETIKQYSDR